MEVIGSNKGSSNSENKSSIISIKKDYSIQNDARFDKEDVPLLDFKENKCTSCLRFIKSLTIEPATFFYLFAFTIMLSCMQNLYMDKACRYDYNYTEEVCNNISAHPTEKANLEILANNYSLYSNLLSFVAAGAMIFIAPWSDKYGRKLPLMFSCIGAIVSDLGVVMCVVYYDSGLILLTMTRLPLEIFGGMICFLTIVYSHAAEVTTEKNRTFKYMTIEVAFMLGMSLGGLVGGYIFKYFGYFYVFIAGTISHTLSAIWILLFFEEKSSEGLEVSWSTKRKNFFRLDSVSRSWIATIRPREDKGRIKIILYFISMGVVILTYEVFGGLGYVYAHHIYNWNPTKYNTVNTAFMMSTFILMAILTPIFLKVLKITDPMLGLMGTISMMAKFILLAFAKYKKALYYMGNAAGFLNGLTPLAVRAEISKIANKEEIVLVFSFLATCEEIFPIIGSAISTKVFNATIDIFPSPAYLMSVGFLLIPMITFIWVYARSRRG